MELKNKLKKLREDKNLTQNEAAKLIGVTSSALGNYEQGTRVPRDEIKKKISDFYGVSIESLFF